jgi:hypothetical protein
MALEARRNISVVLPDLHGQLPNIGKFATCEFDI